MKNSIKLIMRVVAAISAVTCIYIFAPWQAAVYYFYPLHSTVQEQVDDTVNQGFMIPTGQVRAAASLKEQRVAGDEVAGLIGCEFSYLEKSRIDAHTIEHTPKDLDVNGKIVAIVDDMISTGGTICRASDALRRQGAVEVHAACTHGLFTGGAILRLANHVDGVHSTDSLPNPRAVVSAAPALARGLKQLMS